MKQKIRYIKQGGFTLLEVVISMGIILFILGAFIGVSIMVKQSYLFTFNTHATVDHANLVAQQIIQTIRTARAADDGTFMLSELNDQVLSIYSNVDDDNETEKVRYFIEGNLLKRGVIDPSGFPVEYLEENEVVKVLSEFVENKEEPLFYYFNGDWPEDKVNNPLVDTYRLAETRFIQLNLKVNADSERQEGEFLLQPMVQIRNLKDNL